MRIFLVSLARLFCIGALAIYAPIASTQTRDETTQIRNLISNFYGFNSLTLYHCRTLKPGVTKSHANKVMKRYVDSDFFSTKREEMYEQYSKNHEYWFNFYSQFYTSEIALKYAKLCNLEFRNKSKTTLGQDLRFPIGRDMEWPEFKVSKIIYNELRQEKEGLAQLIKVKLNDNTSFLIRYVFRKENHNWRIWDVAEAYQDPDRREDIGVSLQDELATWKEN